MPETDWARARLHVVTGKGGTGKTTVAAALALALAADAKRVLLVEVEGRQGISQTFDVAPLSSSEVRVAHVAGGGEVFGLSVDAKAALMEYLQLFYKLGRAGGVLERFGAVDFATTIAPGLRDVLLTGKVYEAVRRRSDRKGTGGRSAFQYDAVVLDAPPTGRVLRFLNVNVEVAGLAKVGPIKAQSDSITRMLTSSTTAVHVVTLLEEMPVQESIDAIADLAAAGLPLGAIVVNQVREPILSASALQSAADQELDRDDTSADLASAGLRVTAAMVNGLLLEAYDHAHRVALEAAETVAVQKARRPTYTLPALGEGIDAGEVRELAQVLRDQGMV